MLPEIISGNLRPNSGGAAAMLFYFHAGDAPLWVIIFWFLIIPALLVALGVWLCLKFTADEPPGSADEKVNSLLYSLGETEDEEE